MVEPLRHRQTKEAATDMFSLQPPRHLPTLPVAAMPAACRGGRFLGWTGRGRAWSTRAAPDPERPSKPPAADMRGEQHDDHIMEGYKLMGSQSRLAGSTQYSSLGLISTSGSGSNLLSSNGGMSGSGAPRAARCAFALVKPQ